MYKVEWLPVVQDELARLWLTANSEQRGALNAATNEIDRLLRRRPNEQGESRSAGRRILIVAPLAVIFTVRADNSTAYILHVWWFSRRK